MTDTQNSIQLTLSEAFDWLFSMKRQGFGSNSEAITAAIDRLNAKEALGLIGFGVENAPDSWNLNIEPTTALFSKKFA